MDRTQGYLLPAGELGEDDIACTVVFYPDRAEYRAALQGSLAYLATWIAWEKDSLKRGKDAADNWREAYDLTLECWRMGCFDQLTSDVSDILTLLQNKKDCCDDNITYNPSPTVETEIEPGEGSAPAFYGETAVTDWDDWGEHVCFNAHAYVDHLKQKAVDMENAVITNTMYVGFIAAGLTLLSFTGIGLPIAFGLAAAVTSGLIVGATALTFATTEADIEAARDDIVCALLQGSDLASVVEDALGSDSAWDLFYQYNDYASATAIIYEGGHDGEYLPATKLDTCACTDPPAAAPAGYEWVHPPEGYYFWTTNIATHSESYDANTGALTITVTKGGGTQLEYGHAFGDVGSPADDPFEYAYWFHLLSSSVPGNLDILYNLNLQIVTSQGNDGKSFAGYNTDHNSGSIWDNLVNAADVTVNWNAPGQDRIRLVEDPNGSAVSGSYTFTVIVWALAQT